MRVAAFARSWSAAGRATGAAGIPKRRELGESRPRVA